MPTDTASILGVILAGGLSRRMGGREKALLPLAGRPLVGHVRDRLAPQAGRLLLNVNGDAARFGFLGLPAEPDPVAGHAGPLAGILAGMRWAQANDPAIRLIATAAADTPFLPRDLVVRLAAAFGPRTVIALAASAGRVHPVFGLWPVALANDLEAFLASGTKASVLGFAGRHPHAIVDFGFDPQSGPDPFFNVNTPEEIEEAQRWADRETG